MPKDAETRFRWPDFVRYDGRDIGCCGKFPTYAMYMLPAAYMNRVIYLQKPQVVKFLREQSQ